MIPRKPPSRLYFSRGLGTRIPTSILRPQNWPVIPPEPTLLGFKQVSPRQSIYFNSSCIPASISPTTYLIFQLRAASSLFTSASNRSLAFSVLLAATARRERCIVTTRQPTQRRLRQLPVKNTREQAITLAAVTMTLLPLARTAILTSLGKLWMTLIYLVSVCAFMACIHVM